MTQPRQSWVFPILLVLYEISIYLSNDMYLPALPTMMRHLGMTMTDVQLTVTMWLLGSAIMPLVMGALADRFGRRCTLLVGGVIYVLSTVLCAMAYNQYSLLAPRILQGAMISSMMVAGYAAIHESYDHKEAVRILAIMGGVSVLAPALGPLAGAFILLWVGWRGIFWFIAAYASIMLVCLYHEMPETMTDDKKQSLHLGLIMKNYWQVLVSKNFILLMTVLGGVFVGFISWITAGPLLVIEHLGYSEVAFGWMQAGVFFAYIAGSYLVNHWLKSQESYQVLTKGLNISLISGLAVFLFSFFLPHQFYLFLIAVIVYSFGSAICFAPLNRLIIETSNQPMGIRVALFTAGLMASGVLGSAIASVIYNGTSFSLGIIITGGIVIAYILYFISQTQSPKAYNTH